MKNKKLQPKQKVNKIATTPKASHEVSQLSVEELNQVSGGQITSYGGVQI